MKTYYKIYTILIMALLSQACNKWVNLEPVDRLDENQLFVDNAGFMKALNGVYIEMNDANSYGENLTTSALDVMAQNYLINSSSHRFHNFTQFNYLETNVKVVFDGVWAKAYELIANCNIIIEQCDGANGANLSPLYYNIIKGEALALRAMLHLDMLRLFGPIYNEQNKDIVSIPYMDKTGLEIQPLLGSREVITRVKADLQAALKLLEVDPVRTDGVRHYSNPTGPNDFHYRQYRLNYFAAKALLARTCLWEGNHEEALKYSEEVLVEAQNPAKPLFPAVTFLAATSLDKPDRVFSTEVLFSLYDSKRVEMNRRLFDVNLPVLQKLSFTPETNVYTRVNSFYDDSNDFRRRIWQSLSNNMITAVTSVKYNDVVDGPGRYMIPLIRISELLLIAAETHPDFTQAKAYLNQLRTSRNAVSLNPINPTVLKEEILKEFRREMLGEGQMFFFYKRNAMGRVPNPAQANITSTKAMALNNYVVPLPDSEIKQRN